MIQDILPKKLNNTFKVDAVCSLEDLVIVQRQGNLLLKIKDVLLE